MPSASTSDCEKAALTARALTPDHSALPGPFLAPLAPLPQRRSPERARASAVSPRAALNEKRVAVAALRLTSRGLHLSSQPEIVGPSVSGAGTGAGERCVGQDPWLLWGTQPG